MSNSKVIGYEEAVRRIKSLETNQKFLKKLRFQSSAAKNRKEINYLLSIIASEKRARKLYARLTDISGVSSTKRGPID